MYISIFYCEQNSGTLSAVQYIIHIHRQKALSWQIKFEKQTKAEASPRISKAVKLLGILEPSFVCISEHAGGKACGVHAETSKMCENI